MGSCLGGGDEQDNAVQRELNQDRRKDARVHKLLLLGAGGSGKSTFFKQLKTIHGDGHSAREREGFRRQIYGQVVDAMQVLIKQCRVVTSDSPGEDADLDDDDEGFNLRAGMTKEEAAQYAISDDFKNASEHILSLQSGAAGMDAELADSIRLLWHKCQPVQMMFEHRNKICVPDSTKYFLDALDRISSDDYMPTNTDVLLVRYRTTGMTEKTFQIQDAIFKVADVGGQRNERKKWIHFFDNVTAVLFVVSLSCYDEIPFEDVTDLDQDESAANNMIESINVFQETLDQPTFRNTGFILFFNKQDIMQEKIQRVPITVAFPDYTGPQEFQASVEYIRDQFMSRNAYKDREMFAHVTTATDTRNVERVFNDVQQVVVNWSLKNAGLV